MKQPINWTHRRCACEVALRNLSVERNSLRRAGAKAAADAIARAMKSIDGARRHAERFEMQELRMKKGDSNETT